MLARILPKNILSLRNGVPYVSLVLMTGRCVNPVDGQFSNPTGLAVDSLGFVYVIDYNNNRIQKFTNDGTFVTKWGSQGSADRQY